ncbi:chemotaxis response regulator protein-glutamate methylesterase [Chitinibacter sp. SCUT-21]|uniref:protein-glutamate methylesterase/protein-glutamine glutaminase n=1 Tax=Chitinibacter sp. SCUT-21 TaxID=2970891 RepID=UPI0035A65ACB
MAIKVMIVDDSSIVRQLVQEVLSKERDIEVIATAFDPIFAREKMNKQWPDVLLLDIEMPRMDGITFLKQIMAERPTPVVICSSLTEKNANLTMQALSAGALGVINKPAIGFKDYIQDSSADLITAIRAAAQAKMSRVRTEALVPPPSKPKPLPTKPSPSDPFKRATPVAPASASSSSFAQQAASKFSGMNERMGSPKLSADSLLQAPSQAERIPATAKIIAIGTSTGGTQALEAILPRLKSNCPGLAIVQHMPERFTASFATRLNSLCEIEVREAQNNDKILPGLALIAPGGKHLVIRRSGSQYYVEVMDGPLITRHRPSVDVLFRSAALAAGPNAVGYILTGMGDDGAKGLKEMSDAGAITYAQNEETCVVFGMPKEAILQGGASEVIALEEVANSIARYR